ncbi:sigma-70 family RNA polymerase sigma factor [Treponema sp.]|uniref:RNA polymerase sigma factor n=1 Tax=Treponema sp. TaxID=166 RepID=UPI0025DB8C62|nr:sigma-70 family RNA polymerase sigma factor [Treponema sp.]MCR5217086.1 sigma-70 family RNA polymerase sigma factor [Treponema sp.]
MKALTKDDFAGLYRKYAPMVLRRCRSILKDEDQALDAMQDVFLRIMDNSSSIKNVCASLFYVTATRVCLNKIRSEKLRQAVDFDEIAESMADDFSDVEKDKIEASMILESIFAGRDSRDSLIATLHFVDGYTLEETASQLEMSVSGVRKRISELRKYSIKIMSRTQNSKECI